MTGIDPFEFLDRLRRQGVTCTSGVPCSSLTGLIDLARLGRPIGYANAPNEGEALAHAAGTWLGGGAGAVLCQNSGLGNLFNALTSLLIPCQIPAVVVAGWRGRPGGSDEPQHMIMGAISSRLADLAGAKVLELVDAGEIDVAEAAAAASLAERHVLMLLAAEDVFARVSAADPPAQPSPVPRLTLRRMRTRKGGNRDTFIRALGEQIDEASAIVATTGMIGRATCAHADRPGAFYLAGAMGHAASVGLGIAEASGRPTLVLDGDGALLMRASVLPFIGAAQPSRFAHLVLDNGVHASTGGQPSLSAFADLAAAASAFGYSHCLDTSDHEEAIDLCQRGLGGDGPVFIRLHIDAEAPTPPRIRIPLPELALRMRDFCRA